MSLPILGVAIRALHRIRQSQQKRIIDMSNINGRNWIKETLRLAIYLRDNFVCAWCGKRCKGNAITLDHADTRIAGGDHTTGNLFVACRPCNDRRGKRTLLEMASYQSHLQRITTGTFETAISITRRVNKRVGAVVSAEYIQLATLLLRKHALTEIQDALCALTGDKQRRKSMEAHAEWMAGMAAKPVPRSSQTPVSQR